MNIRVNPAREIPPVCLIVPTGVSHPQIQISWCLSPGVMQKMREDAQEGKGYRLLVVAQHEDDVYGDAEVREIFDPLNKISFLTFIRPGPYRIAGFLLSSKSMGVKAGERFEKYLRNASAVSKTDRTFDRRISLEAEKPDWLEGQIKSLLDASAGEKIEGIDMKQIHVPDGIFAAPPAQWKKAIAGYWFGKDATKNFDECDFRGKWLPALALTALIYWWWEPLKRGIYLLLGTVLFLFCGNRMGLVLKKTFGRKFNFQIVDEMKSTPDVLYRLFENQPFYFMPIAFIAYAAIAIITYTKFDDIINFIVEHWPLISTVLVACGIVIAIILLALAAISISGSGTLKAWLEKQKEEQEARAKQKMEYGQSEEIRRLLAAEEVLVCTGEPRHVTFWDIPKEARTWGQLRQHLFANVQQTVCRPFQN